VNFGLPNNNIFALGANGVGGAPNPTVGLITTTIATSRQIQLGLKFLF
jgi:hypothetical protein